METASRRSQYVLDKPVDNQLGPSAESLGPT
jgi:hypothetical protein